MQLGVVLGAGGVVGMAYHAGVLRALEDTAGVSAGDADLLVGTSAGSVIAAHLRSGWSVRDCWDHAFGVHDTQVDLDPDEFERRRQAILAPSWATPSDLVRRGVGSAYVAARSLVRLPVPVPRAPAPLRRRFPGGLFSVEEARERLAEGLPRAWPARPLWLVAADINSGRRVVLGRPGAPPAGLREAVLASCAIPGIYPPVRLGGRTLVDGGAHSSTHLDLAAKAGCDVIIGIAPMAFDPSRAPAVGRQLVRRWPTRALSGEARRARARGAEVLLVRPCADELDLHGTDPLRPAAPDRIARAAYEATARLLETDRFRRVLADVRPAAASPTAAA